jgi:hypothetical protein
MSGVTRPSRLWIPAVVVVVALLSVGCTSQKGSMRSAPAATKTTVNAEVASGDMVAGEPERFLVGLYADDGRVVSFGQTEFRFSYLGTQQSSASPDPAGTATGTYLPTPGTPPTGDGPALVRPSDARGVYQAENVGFDQAGFWQVQVSGNGPEGAVAATAAFQVLAKHELPAPGDQAPRTVNNTLSTTGVPAEAIDSRAASNGGTVPDPELHRWTIRQAIDQHVPALVVFSTPVYCTSRFCGPVTDEIDQLAHRFDDRAAFIHIEIWRDFQNSVVNKAAAQWLLQPSGDLSEPWVYLIGADGRILDRWGVLFDPSDVVHELSKLPKLPHPTGP